MKKVDSIADVPQKPHYVILINKVIKFTGNVASTNLRPNMYSSSPLESCHYITEDRAEWIRVLENLFREEPDRKDLRFYEATYFPKALIKIKIE